MMSDESVKIRGFLMHISHYDPGWCLNKESERPFDVDVALELVEAMAKAKMNLLVVDCADGVRYKSHPELKRHYTAPMSHLRRLAKAAHGRDIDVVPKLNFSRSALHAHDQWMLPYSTRQGWYGRREKYWQVAGDLINELVGVCKPRRYFHIGMDEDHERSSVQYVDDIKLLRRMIRKQRLRPVMWNDSCYWPSSLQVHPELQVQAEKALAAEPRLPKDVVQILWHYERTYASAVKRVVGMGFEAWGAPGPAVQAVRRWRKAIVSNGGTGLLVTRWIKCDRSNREELLDLISTLGPACL